MELTKEFLQEELRNKSTYTIAKETGLYPNKIRRAAQKFGLKIPNHSEAQKIALKTGRTEHPTEGKKRSEQEKMAIAEGVYNAYKDMSEDQKNLISKTHRKLWKKLTPDEKELIRSRGAQAVRKAAKEGSKTELYLRDKLLGYGFDVVFHKKDLLTTQLEVDLLIPSLKIIIEVNGISHYEPIHGEDVLKKKKDADSKKYGILIGFGYCVIVIKHLVKNVSKTYHLNLFKKLHQKIEEIRNKFPKKGERLIEIEA